jgi:hypothetical protein
MDKIEPIEATPSMPDLIKSININQSIQIHADRLASFKSTVSRLKKNGLDAEFKYSKLINSYYTATRTA